MPAQEIRQRVNRRLEELYRRHLGLRQLSDEGMVKVLSRPETGGQEPILGAVGPLQFEAAEHRMEHEFGARRSR